jgi:hypothetical protein
MYKVPYGSKGPEKDKYDVFCIAGMRCKKCEWYVRTTVSTYTIDERKVTRQTTVCGFNKKFYSDMAHNLLVYSKAV